MRATLKEIAAENAKQNYLKNKNYSNENKPLRDNNDHYAELVHGVAGELAKEEAERLKNMEETGITKEMLEDAKEIIDLDAKSITRAEDELKARKEQLKIDKRELLKMEKEYKKPIPAEVQNKLKAERLGISLEELKRIRQNPVNVPERIKPLFKELYTSHGLNGREYVWTLIKRELDKFKREKKKREQQKEATKDATLKDNKA
jgi:hypothetical protein